MNKVCGQCQITLTIENTYLSDWERGGYICKNCRKINRQKNITPEKQATYTFSKNLKYKQDVLNIYGNKCECCGETGWQFLSIDHINNWGGQHRRDLNMDRAGVSFYQWLKKNNYPKEGIRILCMNCNACIGFHGFCSHQIILSDNCVDCGIILDEENHFDFHKKNKVSICKICILLRSVKRRTAQDLTDKRGQTLEQRRKWAKNHTLNLRKQIIEGYGSKCKCCSENNYMFLTIDHINNDGAYERASFKNDMHAFYSYLIEKDFPTDNYQLLCYNCNCSKGFYGKCYHELCKDLNRDDVSISEYKSIILHPKAT